MMQKLNLPFFAKKLTSQLTNYTQLFIVTNVPINPGDAGGPLLNMKGEVVGINTAIFTPTGGFSGISFTLPSNAVKKIVPSLITNGSYARPWLGITGTAITPQIAEALGLTEARGFLVTDVRSGSPAQEAGIRGGSSLTNINGREIAIGGDVIFKIDENNVTKLYDTASYLEREKNVGGNVKLGLLRNGEIEVVNATLVARPSPTSFLNAPELPELPPIPTIN